MGRLVRAQHGRACWDSGTRRSRGRHCQASPACLAPAVHNLKQNCKVPTLSPVLVVVRHVGQLLPQLAAAEITQGKTNRGTRLRHGSAAICWAAGEPAGPPNGAGTASPAAGPPLPAASPSSPSCAQPVPPAVAHLSSSCCSRSAAASPHFSRQLRMYELSCGEGRGHR